MKTAEEFIEEKLRISFEEEPGDFNIHALELKSLLIEFAKYHVEKALEAAQKNTKMDVFPSDQEQWENVDEAIVVAELFDEMEDGVIMINEESIVNAYPLTNIL